MNIGSRLSGLLIWMLIDLGLLRHVLTKVISKSLLIVVSLSLHWTSYLRTTQPGGNKFDSLHIFCWITNLWTKRHPKFLQRTLYHIQASDVCLLNLRDGTHLIGPSCPASPCWETELWTEGSPGSSTRTRHPCRKSRPGLAWATLWHICDKRCAGKARWVGAWTAPCKWGRSARALCSLWAPTKHAKKESKKSLGLSHSCITLVFIPSINGGLQIFLRREGN